MCFILHKTNMQWMWSFYPEDAYLFHQRQLFGKVAGCEIHHGERVCSSCECGRDSSDVHHASRIAELLQVHAEVGQTWSVFGSDLHLRSWSERVPLKKERNRLNFGQTCALRLMEFNPQDQNILLIYSSFKRHLEEPKICECFCNHSHQLFRRKGSSIFPPTLSYRF